MYDHRTTAPHDKDISCRVSASVRAHSTGRTKGNRQSVGAQDRT
uniref:Uncharacterized protein n=1 Tax=Siphoviridae sp. ctLgc23 TaxID=2825455 RepID=A0A8S5QIQ0_9CAUD|nr:MAG TPA: hypothetical protein [Siphoviridae sp. ctLgc23]